MTVQVLKPPYYSYDNNARTSVFLAGSIELGKAEDWQKKFTDAIALYDVQVFNPRRDDWDASWEQSIDNPNFYGQVTWELNHLDNADCIVMYFDPNTKSPISLLELGLYYDRNIMVCCPEGFWRRGNVEIVCERHNIPFFNDIDSLINFYKRQISLP